MTEEGQLCDDEHDLYLDFDFDIDFDHRPRGGVRPSETEPAMSIASPAASRTSRGHSISISTAVMLSLPPRSFARSMNFCTVACAPSAMIGAMSESRR